MSKEQDQKLIANGYEPVAVRGKAPVADGWQSGEISSERIASERAEYPDAASTGLRTGQLVGIDVDVRDPDHVAKLVELAEQSLGETPLGRQGSKGIMLAYRNATPIRKLTVAGKGVKVEILGGGQQFVAFGIHPDTGQPYRWIGEDPDLGVNDPASVPLADLPAVTPDQLRDYARKAADLLNALGYAPTKVSGDTGEERALAAGSGAPVAEKVLRGALSYLDPNEARDEWRNVIAGIRAANVPGDDDLNIRQRIALEWSRGELDRMGRYEDGPPSLYTNDDDVMTVFETMAPRERGITVATLFDKARKAEWQGNPFDDGIPASEKFKGVKLPAHESPALSPNNPVNVRVLEVVDGAPDFPDVGNNGALKPTTANARVALQAVGLECRHDVFHDKLIVGGRVLNQWVGPVTDEIIARLCHMTYEAFRFEPEPKKMQLAVQQLCFESKFNPVVDYLDSLKWDGIPRIETWLIEHVGAPDTPFVRAVSRIALIAAVRRARHPGVKFDEIIVLEGREGLNKSSLIELMAGSENFSDQSILAADDRKQQEQMAGVWLYEIADLTGIRNAEVEKIKAFASRQEDRCRPAYGHFLKSQKRQCILIATTNDTDFLQSQTGNRRWWPIAVSKACDLKTLAAVRDQLWAEAAQLEAQGVSIRLPRDLWGVAGEVQEERRMKHPWEDVLANIKGQQYAIAGRDDRHEQRILSSDVFAYHLKLEPGQQTGWHGKTLKQVMARLGWTHRSSLRVGSRVCGGYMRIVAGPLPEHEREDELPDDPFALDEAS